MKYALLSGMHKGLPLFMLSLITAVAWVGGSTLFAYDWNQKKKGIQSRPATPPSQPARASPERNSIESEGRSRMMSGPPAGFVDCRDSDPENSPSLAGRVGLRGISQEELSGISRAAGGEIIQTPILANDGCQQFKKPDGTFGGITTEGECNKSLFPNAEATRRKEEVLADLRRGVKPFGSDINHPCPFGCAFGGRCTTEEEAGLLREYFEEEMAATAPETQAASAEESVERPRASLYPYLVDTNDFLNRMGPDAEHLLNHQFAGNNSYFIFGSFANVGETVGALQHHRDLYQAMGEGVCNGVYRLGEYRPRGRLNREYCVWRLRGQTKTINRYLKAHFNPSDAGLIPASVPAAVHSSLMTGQPIRAVKIKVQHLFGQPRRRAGVSLFTTQRGNPVWDWREDIVLEAGELTREIAIPINDNYVLDQVIVAEKGHPGRLFVSRIVAEYEVPEGPGEGDNVLVARRGEGGWESGGNVGEMLAANDGFLSADVTLPDGQVLTVSLGETRCLADGQAASPLEEWASGQPAEVVNSVVEQIEQMTGRDLPSQITDVLRGGNSSEETRNITMCDNTQRCQQSGEMMAGMPGGSPFERPDDRISAEEYGEAMRRGDARAQQGGGQETAEQRFTRQLQDPSYGTPTTTVFNMRIDGGTGGRVDPGSIVRVEIQAFPNGSAAVTTTPMEFRQLQAGSESMKAVQPDVSRAATTYANPNDREQQRELESLQQHSQSPARVVVPENAKGQKADHEMSVIEGSPPETTTCSGDDPNCVSGESKERLEGHLSFMEAFLRSRGLSSSSGNGEPSPEEYLGRRREAVSRPGEEGAGSAASGGQARPRFSVEEGCLIHHPDISPAAMPTDEEAQCQNNCNQGDMAVGHTCEELGEEVSGSTRPNAVCAQNFRFPGGYGAVDCPPDNPNCTAGVGDVPRGGGGGGGGGVDGGGGCVGDVCGPGGGNEGGGGGGGDGGGGH